MWSHILIFSTKEQQIVRLMDRNDFSRAEAEARVKSQLRYENLMIYIVSCGLSMFPTALYCPK